MTDDILLGSELGPEFDRNQMLGQVKLKIGSGLAIQPDGTIVVTSGAPSLTITTEPTYEYREIWAEESGGLNAAQSEWSYGNGATGFMGIPHLAEEGWEVTHMYFNSDVYNAGANVTIALMQFETASNNISNEVSTITVANSTDGGGSTNHAYKTEKYDPPIPIPFPTSGAPLGFYTKTLTGGTISDARVGARLRRQTGTHVTGVTLN